MSDIGLVIPDDVIADEAWQRLECVYDPELGIDLVNLGLVYAVDVKDGSVEVRMTLTTPGCPMSDGMPAAVERALFTIPGVPQVKVDLVWEPRWEPEMMSDRAKRELGWL